MEMLKKFKKKEGFTLVELIIVIAIIAVLAAIAVPNLLGSVEKSKKAKDEANAKLIADAIIIYVSEHPLSADKSNVKLEGTSDPVVKAVGDQLSKLPKVESKEYKDDGFFYISVTTGGEIKVAGKSDGSKVIYPK